MATSGTSISLLTAVTATGAGSTSNVAETEVSFQAFGDTSAGTGSATIKVEVSNDGVGWVELATISLDLTTSSDTDAQGFVADRFYWDYVRGYTSAISGTNAQITLVVGA